MLSFYSWALLYHSQENGMFSFKFEKLLLCSETEADYIGLLLMAQACYDPRESVTFWERMGKVHQGQGTQFLSTHPSHANRSKRLKESMNEAMNKFHSSDCHSYMHELDQMFDVMPGNSGIVRW